MITIISEAPISSSVSVKPLSSRATPRSLVVMRLRGDRAHIARLGEVGAHGGGVVAVQHAVLVWIGVDRRGIARGVVALRVLDAVAGDAGEAGPGAPARGGAGEGLRSGG